jgi:hypothetical protein
MERSEFQNDRMKKLMVTNNIIREIVEKHYIDSFRIRETKVDLALLLAENELAIIFERDWNTYLTKF